MIEIKYKAYLKKSGFVVDIEQIDFVNKIIYHENIQEDNMTDFEPASVVDPICHSKFEDINLMQNTDTKMNKIYVVLNKDGTNPFNRSRGRKIRAYNSLAKARMYCNYQHQKIIMYKPVEIIE